MSGETQTITQDTSLVGQKFNKLTIIEELQPEIDNSGSSRRIVKVACSCGNEAIKKLKYLKSGETKSCGSCPLVDSGEVYNGKVVHLSDQTKDEPSLIGKTFGRLEVVDAGYISGKTRLIKVKCSCGNQTLLIKTRVVCGETLSCGCLKVETTIERSTSHGLSRSKTYATWSNMKDRCNNEDRSQFKDYGGRGISYCTKWETFEGFLEDMGEKPENKTLERVDVNKGYYKENCVWADLYQQAANKRRSVVNVSGKTGVYWSQEEGKWKASITYKRVKYHLGTFINFEDAVDARRNAELKYFGFNKE